MAQSRRKLKRAFSQPLLRAAIAVLPWVFHAYMRLVWMTSRVTSVNIEESVATREARGGAVFAVYHETALITLFRARGMPLLTVASRSDSGEVIAAVIEHLGLSVARGGSSRSRRRRTPVVKEVITYMQAHPGTVTAITVDGSSGPRRKLKPGVLEIARAMQAPLYAVHAHASPAFRLPTWDRTIIPLPLSRIRILAMGPVEVPADATAEQFDAIKRRVQELLDETAARVERGEMNV